MAEQEIVRAEQEIRLGIIPARTPHDVIVQASAIAEELAKIIKSKKLAVTIQERSFVKVEGWSTMGAMLGVLPREVLSNRFEDGSYEAIVELVRITDGAIIGRASAFVGMDEKDTRGRPTWASRPEYARRSMAVTRATGKAYRLGFSWIMGLAGYEPTPAEEMEPIVEGQFREEKPEVAQSDQAPTNGKKKSWPADYVQALINTKVSPDAASAVGILNHLNPDSLENAVKLGKTYRGFRDQGNSRDEAFAKVLAGEQL